MNFIKIDKFKFLVGFFSLLLLTSTTYSYGQEAGQMSANGPTLDGVDATASVWPGIIFNIMLFLLACIVIAIIGRILKIYDLTLQIQNKNPLDWNRIMAVGFGLFLLAGLYGAYWEYTVQGAKILPEAASQHGVRIDEMFSATLIITTIVFIGTQVMLFTFAYIYRGSQKRKAYFFTA